MNTVQQSPRQAPSRFQRITIYPYLVTGHQFWLQLYNINRGVISLHVYALNGEQVYHVFMSHINHFASHTIHLPETIQRGIYKVTIRSEAVYYTQPLVIA